MNIIYGFLFITILYYIFESFNIIKSIPYIIKKSHTNNTTESFNDITNTKNNTENNTCNKCNIWDSNYPSYFPNNIQKSHTNNNDNSLKLPMPICVNENSDDISAPYAPLIYVSNRKFYFNRMHLDDEAKRQNNITQTQITKLHNLYKDKNTTEEGKNLIRQELQTFDWQRNKTPYKKYNYNGNKRIISDIITDYDVNTFGAQRHWIEVHSHI